MDWAGRNGLRIIRSGKRGWRSGSSPLKGGSAERKPTATVAAAASAGKKKLSYLEAREYAGIEQQIAQADELLRKRQAALEDPAIASDAAGLVRAGSELEEAQSALDRLYARWHELEEKQG